MLVWLVTIAAVGLLIRRQSRLAVYLIITGVGGLILDPSLKAMALAVIMPIGVAISRMYRGMHHPTDFLGAILLSALWIGLLCWVVRPNADVRQGNRPAIESEQVGQLDDELAKAGGPG